VKSFIVEVRQRFRVTLDETKFTPEFAEEYERYIGFMDGIEDHARHLAQLEARGIDTTQFVEGYGETAAMGIKVEDLYRETETEIIE
jgi:hypothetical protein